MSTTDQFDSVGCVHQGIGPVVSVVAVTDLDGDDDLLAQRSDGLVERQIIGRSVPARRVLAEDRLDPSMRREVGREHLYIFVREIRFAHLGNGRTVGKGWVSCIRHGPPPSASATPDTVGRPPKGPASGANGT